MSLDMLGATLLASKGGTVVSVTVSPQSPSVEMGKTQQFTAVATDLAGKSFTPPVVSWTSAGCGVIGPKGLFTPTQPGTCVVTARVGAVSGQTTVTVEAASPGASSSEEDEEEDLAAEEVDDIVYPRQGLASFHACMEEIDQQRDTRLSIRRHYPDLAETEGQPFDQEAAKRWAGFGEGEDDLLGHGGHGGGGGHGHHGGHGGGRGWRGGGGWGWGGGPWVNVVDPLEIDEGLDADDIVDAVVDRLARRGVHAVGEGMTEPGYVTSAVKDFQAKLAGAPVTFAVAKVIASRAIDMANEAEKIVKSQGSNTLIGPAMYDVPRKHVQWHVDNSITKELAGKDPRTTPYERAEDLKKWAAECYRGLMTASQDASLRDRFKAEFWSDVMSAVADMPSNIKKSLGSGVEWLTGIPLWGWGLIGLAVSGLVGFGLYKILLAAAPVATKVAMEKYLPR